MTFASTVFKKSTFLKCSPLNAIIGSKFDLAAKYVMVNVGSVFEQIW